MIHNVNLYIKALEGYKKMFDFSTNRYTAVSIYPIIRQPKVSAAMKIFSFYLKLERNYRDNCNSEIQIVQDNYSY